MTAGSVTLVLLSYDEVEALERLLPHVPFHLFDRVLAIDPGSTDGTLDIYRRNSIEVVIQQKRGRGQAFVLAQQIVGTEFVVFFSVDGNEDPQDLPRMIELLRSGYDQVIAGRYVQKGSQSDDSDDPLKLRKAGATVFGILVRLIWRSGVWDATNGFRGYRVEAMRRLNLDASGHDIEYQSTIRATKLGQRICEFPTIERPRLGGWRKVTAGTWALGVATLRCLVRELRIGRSFAS